MAACAVDVAVDPQVPASQAARHLLRVTRRVRDGPISPRVPIPTTTTLEVRDGRQEGAVILVTTASLATFQVVVALPSMAAPEAPRRKGAETTPTLGIRVVVPAIHALRLHQATLA